MKTDDKVLFDRAKTRIDISKLDEHSKEGISVALAMAGEACNGMSKEEKIETLTRAVFSFTLAVSYFMAQAPEHTKSTIDTAIKGHVGECAKLMKKMEAEGVLPVPPPSASQKIDTEAVTSTVSIGKWLTFKGPIAKYAAAVIGIIAYLYVSDLRQTEALKKQEESIRKSLQEKFVPELMEAVKSAATRK